MRPGDTLTSLWTAITGAKAAIITGLACIALCLPLGYCRGYEAARNKAEAEAALANVTALQRARTADEAAATERVTDALSNAKHESELTDAIADTPDTDPDPIRVLLGCQRLRASGRAEADLPAPCRSASGGGTQAGSQP